MLFGNQRADKQLVITDGSQQYPQGRVSGASFSNPVSYQTPEVLSVSVLLAAREFLPLARMMQQVVPPGPSVRHPAAKTASRPP